MDITSEEGDTDAGCAITRNQLHITTENFRPNLLVSSSTNQPHEEDQWSKLTLQLFDCKDSDQLILSPSTSEGVFSVSGPCPRCSMVNVSSSSGAMDCRAFQALSTYRKQERNVFFGQLLTYCGEESQSSKPMKYIAVGSVVKWSST